MRFALSFVIPGLLFTSLSADGPKDNLADNVRPIPPPGIEISEEDRADLGEVLDKLKVALAELRTLSGDKSFPHRDVVARYLPDAAVFYWSVSDALENGEFFSRGDVAHAKVQLQMGLQRAAELKQGLTPWLEQTGGVIRGYRSKIDHSIQPYAVYVPADYNDSGGKRYRCDLWFHGRGEKLSEVVFIRQRMNGQGAVSSNTHFMVHPYGRYSNANKFAGEVDTFEVLSHLQGDYRIDEDRIAARGFSMGGAACWQFAVHYADRWFAATPGAGFSETPEFLRTFQQETLTPAPYEKRLWHLYDCTDYAINLFHCPTIAYSGEIDRQKQAADMMEEYLRREGIDLVHIIGPQTAHRIHPEALKEIEARLSALEVVGRQRNPREIHMATYTLKYNRMHWVTIDALGEHWTRARVDAAAGDNEVVADTTNVTQLSFDMPPGTVPFDILRPVRVSLDGQVFDGPRPKSDRSWNCTFYRKGPTWYTGRLPGDGLRKRHDLQGPIDDAFMDSFIFVEPSGTAAHPAIEKWTRSELEHAIVHWRKQFRGHARVKKDSEITEDDVASANLILFGDPKSNAILGRIAEKLPIVWNASDIRVGDRSYPSAENGLILIAPNPLNPDRYVVLNSGFTYREYDYLNNARQVPKLPDWAVVDVGVPPHSRGPGRIVRADFFDESWRLEPSRP